LLSCSFQACRGSLPTVCNESPGTA
jgi:hypothetical protein